MLRFITSIPKNILQFTITGLRPFLGPATCKYPIGCTQFALEQLETQSLPYALAAIIKRLISCAPWPSWPNPSRLIDK